MLDQLTKEFGGIFAGIYEVLNLGYYRGAVFGVSYAKPARSSVENFNSACAFLDELVHHERNEELGLEVAHILVEELGKV
jgi:hypothetical protein